MVFAQHIAACTALAEARTVTVSKSLDLARTPFGEDVIGTLFISRPYRGWHCLAGLSEGHETDITGLLQVEIVHLARLR